MSTDGQNETPAVSSQFTENTTERVGDPTEIITHRKVA